MKRFITGFIVGIIISFIVYFFVYEIYNSQKKKGYIKNLLENKDNLQSNNLQDTINKINNSDYKPQDKDNINYKAKKIGKKVASRVFILFLAGCIVKLIPMPL